MKQTPALNWCDCFCTAWKKKKKLLGEEASGGHTFVYSTTAFNGEVQLVSQNNASSTLRIWNWLDSLSQ